MNFPDEFPICTHRTGLLTHIKRGAVAAGEIVERCVQVRSTAIKHDGELAISISRAQRPGRWPSPIYRRVRQPQHMPIDDGVEEESKHLQASQISSWKRAYPVSPILLFMLLTVVVAPAGQLTVRRVQAEVVQGHQEEEGGAGDLRRGDQGGAGKGKCDGGGPQEAEPLQRDRQGAPA